MKDKKKSPFEKTVIIPDTVKVIETICGKWFANKLKCIILFANSVVRGTGNIAETMKKHILAQVKSFFSYTWKRKPSNLS